jgi:hypothetical protein
VELTRQLDEVNKFLDQERNSNNALQEQMTQLQAMQDAISTKKEENHKQQSHDHQEEVSSL